MVDGERIIGEKGTVTFFVGGFHEKGDCPLFSTLNEN